MSVRTFIIYQNDNGTEAFEFDETMQSPSEIYAERLRQYRDDYFETSAFLVAVIGNSISDIKLDVDEIFIPEEEENL